MENKYPFNVRVYGLLFDGNNEQVLVCKETGMYKEVVKFPGGGLEFGEGLKEALKREWEEELGIEIAVGKHIYTTDYFQKSFFDESQVISVYYQVFTHSETIFPLEKAAMQFYFLPINENLVTLLSLPIDKYLVEHYIL